MSASKSKVKSTAKKSGAGKQNRDVSRQHPFLDAIGVDYRDSDEKSIALRGFDDADTFSLDYTMLALLYERLTRYQQIAQKTVNLDLHTVEVEDDQGKIVEKTQGEATQDLLDLSKRTLQHYFDGDRYSNVDEERIDEDAARIWRNWSRVATCTWW